jgi:hypothetical protein
MLYEVKPRRRGQIPSLMFYSASNIDLRKRSRTYRRLYVSECSSCLIITSVYKCVNTGCSYRIRGHGIYQLACG